MAGTEHGKSRFGHLASFEVNQPNFALDIPPRTPAGKDSDSDQKITILKKHGYKVGEQIGRGSYARVKLAYSGYHQRLVAIKIISKFRTPEDYVQEFLPRELEVVRGLQHPNLIRFYQSIETTHRVFIIMEYAENGSLLDLIRRVNKVPEDKARKLFKQIIDVVSYIHGKGIVHRWTTGS